MSRRPSRALLRSLSAITVTMVALMLGASARAQTPIEAARQQVEVADFRGALDTLERALAGGSLRRPDAVALLALRGLVHLALGDQVQVDHDLECLAALDPHHAFPPATNPDLVARFAAATHRQPPLVLTISATPRPVATGPVELRAELSQAPAGLVEGVRIVTRMGRQPWRTSNGTSVKLELAATDALSYYAEALGLGGTMLMQTETKTLPASLPASRSEESLRQAPPAQSRGRAAWWLGIGAVAVVASGIATVWLLGRDDGRDIQPSPPMIDW